MQPEDGESLKHLPLICFGVICLHVLAWVVVSPWSTIADNSINNHQPKYAPHCTMETC